MKFESFIIVINDRRDFRTLINLFIITQYTFYDVRARVILSMCFLFICFSHLCLANKWKQKAILSTATTKANLLPIYPPRQNAYRINIVMYIIYICMYVCVYWWVYTLHLWCFWLFSSWQLARNFVSWKTIIL